ncbi:hypothetical protein COU76_01220 [Candidatus Peregrinibacteria bacterium CG10_big_fil_rev_8_21_14_0_10_49_10]|nr:MAG: hypothetical protein COU76_01220 [Candidatus Peregrinibacteria bacterium CG10_big_fil_rev_8_21_14_0_10_49_10]
MSDDSFVQKIQKQEQLTQEQEQSANKAVEGKMEEEHKNFLTVLFGLIDKGEISVDDPQTMLKQDVYQKLDEEWVGKVDLALLNIVNQVRLIENFRKDKNTPDESPQLQTMVEQLWQMKQRIEDHYDVFVF